MAGNDPELMACYLSEWRRRLAHERLSATGAANVANMVRDTYLEGAWDGAIPLFSPPRYRPCTGNHWTKSPRLSETPTRDG